MVVKIPDLGSEEVVGRLGPEQRQAERAETVVVGYCFVLGLVLYPLGNGFRLISEGDKSDLAVCSGFD